MATTHHALQTEDGTWTCWDVVLPAWEIAQLFRQGYIRIDPEHQRGKNPVTGKSKIDEKKVARWAQQLIDGDCVLGQLTLNYRADDPRSTVEYFPDRKEVKVQGIAYAPDSAHRILSIVEADESVERGSGFNSNRQVSVRIYNVPTIAENRLFFALNQEGQKADATRSKYLHPGDVAQRLAKELVERSPFLGPGNVNTVQDRISAKDPRLVAFNTIAKGIETGWEKAQVDEDRFDEVVDWLVDFWARLVAVRPELKPLPLAKRQAVRAEFVSATAVAVHAYLAVAYEVWSSGRSLDVLDALADDEFFRRDNPVWVRRGILVPEADSKGQTRLNMRNALQTRAAFTDVLRERLGLDTHDDDAVPELVEPAHTKEEAVERIADMIGVAAPPMSTGSTEPKEIFELVNDHLGLGLDPTLSKPRLGRAIADLAGLPWGPDCDSTTSASGGGSTVTLNGLNTVLQAVEVLRREAPADARGRRRRRRSA